MKKLLCLLSALFALSGCSAPQTYDAGKIHILCTIFPQYDWVREITKGAENTDVTLLIDNGTDMHSFQPSADDIIKLSSADAVIYVGGTSDKWIKNTLDKTPEVTAVNMLDILGNSVLDEEHVDGMEEETHLGHDKEADEHVWLSLRNAEKICSSLADTISDIDPQNSELYHQNAKEYISELQQLDEQYSTIISSSKRKTLVFADRFPFRYLTEDYGLTYYAAFPGCSAESEASFETITFLAGKLDSEQLPAVMIIDGGNAAVAETVINNSNDKNRKILTLDSLQSVKMQDIETAGLTYLSAMRKNLAAIAEALN